MNDEHFKRKVPAIMQLTTAHFVFFSYKWSI